MTYRIERELRRFDELAMGLNGPNFRVDRIVSHGYAICPHGSTAKVPGGKRYALTLMGLTHGNETAGVAVLNELLAQLSAGIASLPGPTAFILGNPEAALANKRFLERDLNRSFARDSQLLREERRARELSAVLAESAWMIDYHQVSRPSSRPFFIFPHSEGGIAFARDLAPRHTIVTHWGDVFSAEGQCSDEFVNSRGGVGISIELGQNGFDPYQIATGVEIGTWAFATVAAYMRGEPALRAAHARSSDDEVGELYTWAEIVPWPEGSYVELAPGWANFAEVAAGEQLGTVDGKAIFAKLGGRMLFPKYLTREEQRVLTTRPTELCRIMRRIEAAELPGG